MHHGKCQLLHGIRDEFRRSRGCWLAQETCHGHHRLSEETYQEDAVHGVVRPRPDRPDADVGLHRREQLLHHVLGPVLGPRFARVHVPVRDQAEEALPARGPLLEEEAQRLLLGDLHLQAAELVDAGGELVKVHHRVGLHVQAEVGVDGGAFWSQMQGGVDVFSDVGNSLIKAVVFAVAVGLISLYQGFTARPTPEGVSRATTRTVVISSLMVLGLDFIMTALMFSV